MKTRFCNGKFVADFLNLDNEEIDETQQVSPVDG
jgi:hypothetical protein